MFKFLKTIKDNSNKIIELEKELVAIKIKYSEILKTIEAECIYNAIEMPFSKIYNRKILLLMEAKKRGYFNDDNYFVALHQ